MKKKRKALRNTEKKDGVVSAAAVVPTKSADAPAAASADNDELPAEKKTRKRNHSGEDAQNAQVSPEEQARRDLQRRVQQLATKLREAGKTKSEIKEATQALTNSVGRPWLKAGSRHSKRMVARGERREKQQKERSETLKEMTATQGDVTNEVVIIPVLWRGQQDNDGIETAAKNVQQLLLKEGVRACVDSRRQYKLGEKLAHWESQGMMMRIQLGPKDFAAGKLCVSKATAPGDSASVQKKLVRLPPKGSRRILLALKEFGLDKIAIQLQDDDKSEENSVEGRTAPVAAPDGVKADEKQVRKKKKKRRTA